MAELSNLQTYLAIAEDALATSQAACASKNVIMADGAPGVVVALDPEQHSFKQSLVAIVFACLYLEALLYKVGNLRLGASYQDFASYEDKLRALGIHDGGLLAAVKRLRNVRKSIVHEKVAAVADFEEFFAAQHEATRALDAIHQVAALLLPEQASGRP
jgi:hypothetical protein